jgi:acetoacetate decarboxylase
MARLRYVKTPEQVKSARDTDPEFLESRIRSIRIVYETDRRVAAAVVPKPLQPDERPEVCVTFSEVAIQVAPELRIEIGSAIFGVRALHDGVPGIYLITMPMTTEQAVVGGRETYGEPKKIATIDFEREGERVSARVARMGIPYLEVEGTLADSLGPRRFTEHAYCFKAMPSCEKGRDFDTDPLLVRLEWRHAHETVHRIAGAELSLRESPFDPVADLPLRRLVTAEYEEGTTESTGHVLSSIPGEWLLPFLHQRYDDPTHPGLTLPDN